LKNINPVSSVYWPVKAIFVGITPLTARIAPYGK
jgi:hypothetical protein